MNKDFQDVWATKLPWAKLVVGSNEKVNMGRCHVCFSTKSFSLLSIYPCWKVQIQACKI